jgi:hypothetical protein
MDGLCFRGFRAGRVRVKTRRAFLPLAARPPFDEHPAAILIKLFAVLLFAVMSVLVRLSVKPCRRGRWCSPQRPCDLLVVLIYTWRGEIGSAVRTDGRWAISPVA